MDHIAPRHPRDFLARRHTRQVLVEAGRSGTDAGPILTALHGLAPNRKNRERAVRRLSRLPGVVRAALTADGIAVTLREAVTVTLTKDGVVARTEERIVWTKVRAFAGRGSIGFSLRQVQLTAHAIQRMIERSACVLDDVLGLLDAAMLRVLGRLDAGAPIRDRDDDYLPAEGGAWAGGIDATACDPAWGPAFQGRAMPIEVFSIHTFLGEDMLRPTVWLAVSRAAG